MTWRRSVHWTRESTVEREPTPTFLRGCLGGSYAEHRRPAPRWLARHHWARPAPSRGTNGNHFTDPWVNGLPERSRSTRTNGPAGVEGEARPRLAADVSHSAARAS